MLIRDCTKRFKPSFTHEDKGKYWQYHHSIDRNRMLKDVRPTPGYVKRKYAAEIDDELEIKKLKAEEREARIKAKKITEDLKQSEVDYWKARRAKLGI